ncbi:RHS repeat-associated core domain-containing protein [Pseudomonas putida CSV86]|uniref:RHS repeat-associated core domain-containing protein n=1 Tax=Pseudomonas bharatica CSV86 TaxID=1005395 RepID=A0A7K4EMU6_9PSED|nr:RHS repeat-associated core domain-containing protein [Pseudomonas bharatica CSV86]
MPTLPAVRTDRTVPDATRAAFNGQVLEPWGCYLPGNGYRAYNPILLRFHGPDRWSPFQRGGLNPYAYCSGDPVNAVDPTGRWEEKITPLLSLGLNMMLFSLAAYALRSTAPAMQKRAPLTATYISFSGSLIGMYGSVEQLLGNPEGRYLNWLGTSLSTISAATRVWLARRVDRQDRFNERIQVMRDKMYRESNVKYVPPASPPQTPVPLRSVTPPASTPPANPVQRTPPPPREQSASPISSIPSHVSGSPRSGSIVSVASTSSRGSVIGDLPKINRDIRGQRKQSVRFFATNY